MSLEGPLNEEKCGECGQVTKTKHWQSVEFCGGCGVAFDATDGDPSDHLAVGLTLTHDEVDRLADGDEVSLTRAINSDQYLTVQLLKELP